MRKPRSARRLHPDPEFQHRDRVMSQVAAYSDAVDTSEPASACRHLGFHPREGFLRGGQFRQSSVCDRWIVLQASQASDLVMIVPFMSVVSCLVSCLFPNLAFREAASGGTSGVEADDLR